MLLRLLRRVAATLALVAVPVAAFADGPAGASHPINNGDCAWVLTATALVFLMTPGLAQLPQLGGKSCDF